MSRGGRRGLRLVRARTLDPLAQPQRLRALRVSLQLGLTRQRVVVEHAQPAAALLELRAKGGARAGKSGGQAGGERREAARLGSVAVRLRCAALARPVRCSGPHLQLAALRLARLGVLQILRIAARRGRRAHAAVERGDLGARARLVESRQLVELRLPAREVRARGVCGGLALSVVVLGLRQLSVELQRGGVSAEGGSKRG